MGGFCLPHFLNVYSPFIFSQTIAVLTLCDTNEDGVITQQEFCDAFISMAMLAPQFLASLPPELTCFQMMEIIATAINKNINDKIGELILFQRGRGVPGWETR